MLVSGFTFIRNAVKFDYPIVEAIQSLLPLCDEFVLALGDSDDGTDALIDSINSDKIKCIHTVWDPNLRVGGKVLADETNKALAKVNSNATWCIYIQGDECLHEKDFPAIRQAMEKYADDENVEGLLFNYWHFYATYDYISDSFSRYRREVRIIKNNLGIQSWGDAQGFRRQGEKLRVKLIQADVYHYGMVKPPKQQQDRFKYMHKLWHSDEVVNQMTGALEEYNYENKERLIRFQGSHPHVIQDRIDHVNWGLPDDPTKFPLSFKVKLKYLVFKMFGIRIGEYRNYKQV